MILSNVHALIKTEKVNSRAVMSGKDNMKAVNGNPARYRLLESFG